jgi:hypothetical protein
MDETEVRRVVGMRAPSNLRNFWPKTLSPDYVARLAHGVYNPGVNLSMDDLRLSRPLHFPAWLS